MVASRSGMCEGDLVLHHHHEGHHLLYSVIFLLLCKNEVTNFHHVSLKPSVNSVIVHTPYIVMHHGFTQVI